MIKLFCGSDDGAELFVVPFCEWLVERSGDDASDAAFYEGDVLQKLIKRGDKAVDFRAEGVEDELWDDETV